MATDYTSEAIRETLIQQGLQQAKHNASPEGLREEYDWNVQRLKTLEKMKIETNKPVDGLTLFLLGNYMGKITALETALNIPYERQYNTSLHEWLTNKVNSLML